MIVKQLLFRVQRFVCVPHFKYYIKYFSIMYFSSTSNSAFLTIIIFCFLVFYGNSVFLPSVRSFLFKTRFQCFKINKRVRQKQKIGWRETIVHFNKVLCIGVGYIIVLPKIEWTKNNLTWRNQCLTKLGQWKRASDSLQANQKLVTSRTLPLLVTARRNKSRHRPNRSKIRSGNFCQNWR